MALRKPSIKEVIHDLCKVLRVFSTEKLSAETLRLAKHDKQEATERMWTLLFHLVCFVENLGIKSQRAFELYDVVSSVKLALYYAGYRRPVFYLLPRNMSFGSRELLLAFAWLLAKFDLVKLILYNGCTPVFDTSRKTWAKAAKEMCESMIVTDERSDRSLQSEQTLTAMGSLNCRLHSFGKVKSNLRCCKLILDGMAKQLTPIDSLCCKERDSSNMEKIKNKWVPFLTGNNEVLLNALESEEEIINSALRWSLNQRIFWRWIEDILEKAQAKTLHEDALLPDILASEQIFLSCLLDDSVHLYFKQMTLQVFSSSETQDYSTNRFELVPFASRFLTDYCSYSRQDHMKHLVSDSSLCMAKLDEVLQNLEKEMDIMVESSRTALTHLHSNFVEQTIILPPSKR